MTQLEIGICYEIASQAISDPYVKNGYWAKTLKIKIIGKPDMVFVTHIFLLMGFNIRATRPKKNHIIPIDASSPI